MQGTESNVKICSILAIMNTVLLQLFYVLASIKAWVASAPGKLFNDGFCIDFITSINLMKAVFLFYKLCVCVCVCTLGWLDCILLGIKFFSGFLKPHPRYGPLFKNFGKYSVRSSKQHKNLTGNALFLLIWFMHFYFSAIYVW